MVLPAHNEQPFLEATVDELVSGLRERRADFEILVVENGSTDDTAAEAERLAQKVPELELVVPGTGVALAVDVQIQGDHRTALGLESRQ